MNVIKIKRVLYFLGVVLPLLTWMIVTFWANHTEALINYFCITPGLLIVIVVSVFFLLCFLTQFGGKNLGDQ